MADDKSSRFTELRDEAFGASGSAHNRMTQELAIYHNVGAYRDGEMLGGQYRPITEQSLNPEIQKGINRLIPVPPARQIAGSGGGQREHR